MTLPSLLDVKEALSKAMAWLSRSEPFLLHCSSLESASSSLLKVDTLKVPDVYFIFSLLQVYKTWIIAICSNVAGVDF